MASSGASAHVWQIGFKALIDGSVDFYGVSWHTQLEPAQQDDFVAFPSGLVVNGFNVTFDIGQVFDLNDCNGLAGTSGTCSPIWNSLGLDTALQSTQDSTGDTYGKYAVVNLDPTELAAIGLGQGSNSVTFTSFSPFATWAPRNFASGAVPIDIVVLPPTPTGVPVPATLALLGMGLVAFGFARQRAHK